MWTLRSALWTKPILRWRKVTSMALVATLLASSPSTINAEVPGYPGVKLFEVPAIAARAGLAARALQRGDTASAETIVTPLLAQYPKVGKLNLLQAILDAATGQQEAALERLEAAAENDQSLDMRQIMATAPFKAIRKTERGAKLSQRAPIPAQTAEAAPALASAKDNSALVSAANTVWDAESGSLRAAFRVPKIFARRPAVTERFLQGREREAAQLLNRLVKRGKAAGMKGDLYDNRDGGHSAFKAGLFPQLANITYSPDARAAGLHYGINSRLYFGAITLGNSSTAIRGPYWRSQARAAMTDPMASAHMFRLYSRNHLYFFPEAGDHKPDQDKGHGDLLPANQPFMLISQGQSGSDRPIMRAAAMIMAAFRPDTKVFLQERGLIAPAIQWAFRQGIRAGDGYADFLGPLAHPSAFRGEGLDPVKMIEVANALTPKDVPPAIRLRLLQESADGPELGAFSNGLTGRLFENDAAIAHIWRGVAHRKNFTLSAGETADPNGRPLQFEWRLLRGNPEKVRITPLNETGTAATVSVDWQDRAPVPGRSDITSTRIDIAVFAYNGVHYSLPGYFSLLLPPDQIRSYETGPDGTQRVTEVDYNTLARKNVYADPVLFPRRDWRDKFHYDDRGQLTGFTRTRGNRSEEYTRHGLRILERDLLGRPFRTEVVSYPLKSDSGKRPSVAETPTGKIVIYRYAGPDDQTGQPSQ